MLKVKDASPADKKLNFDANEPPILGNSFKITIKNTDHKTKFIFDNMNTKLNSDNSLTVEKLNTQLNVDSYASDSDNTYSHELCINDFSKNNLNKNNLLVNDDFANTNNNNNNLQKHSFTSYSNNSTIIINSINTSTPSSSSSSPSSTTSTSNTTPAKMEFNLGTPIAANSSNDTQFMFKNSSMDVDSSNQLNDTTYYRESFKLNPIPNDNTNLKPSYIQPTTGKLTNENGSNSSEDMLQNLLEKFEKFYNNSIETNITNFNTTSVNKNQRHQFTS